MEYYCFSTDDTVRGTPSKTQTLKEIVANDQIKVFFISDNQKVEYILVKMR